MVFLTATSFYANSLSNRFNPFTVSIPSPFQFFIPFNSSFPSILHPFNFSMFSLLQSLHRFNSSFPSILHSLQFYIPSIFQCSRCFNPFTVSIHHSLQFYNPFNSSFLHFPQFFDSIIIPSLLPNSPPAIRPSP